jgi:hypothetical protein
MDILNLLMPIIAFDLEIQKSTLLSPHYTFKLINYESKIKS